MMTSTLLNLDRFAPSARAALQSAQQHARRLQTQEVYPEHLLLGVLTQQDEEVAEVVSRLGMNLPALRAQAEDLLGNLPSAGAGKRSIHLSQEAQACLDWTRAFAQERGASSVPSSYVLLGAVRHQRVQPFLILLLSSETILPTYLSEREGAAYTQAMDQLIQARVGKQIDEPLSKRAGTRASITVELPTILFADLLGAQTAKQELGEVITFLRRPQLFRSSAMARRDGRLHGVLLVGHPCTERTLLVYATASEAVVPLVCLRLANLIAGLVGLAPQEASQQGRCVIRQVFEQATKRAPSLLLLNDLDELERLGAKEARQAMVNQVLVEMDGLEPYPPVVVVATTARPDALEPTLLSRGRFDQRIVFSASLAVHPAAQTKLCLSCKRDMLAHWKYCIYCGASLLKTCPVCGAPHIEVEGARYCFECGSATWSG
jgi:ATPase family associated with various cellular activities (AAA)/Clp amino terminal domain, pathogenicity island component/Double zinc ribbon